MSGGEDLVGFQPQAFGGGGLGRVGGSHRDRGGADLLRAAL